MKIQGWPEGSGQRVLKLTRLVRKGGGFVPPPMFDKLNTKERPVETIDCVPVLRPSVVGRRLQSFR